MQMQPLQPIFTDETQYNLWNPLWPMKPKCYYWNPFLSQKPECNLWNPFWPFKPECNLWNPFWPLKPECHLWYPFWPLIPECNPRNPFWPLKSCYAYRLTYSVSRWNWHLSRSPCTLAILSDWPTVCIGEITISLGCLMFLLLVQIDLQCVSVKSSYSISVAPGSHSCHWYSITVCLNEIT